MTTANLPLVLDLVGWVADEPRTYRELMDAWRTSCPRLTIWEDAVEDGYLRREARDGLQMVVATPAGLELLRQHGRLAGDLAGDPAATERVQMRSARATAGGAGADR